MLGLPLLEREEENEILELCDFRRFPTCTVRCVCDGIPRLSGGTTFCTASGSPLAILRTVSWLPLQAWTVFPCQQKQLSKKTWKKLIPSPLGQCFIIKDESKLQGGLSIAKTNTRLKPSGVGLGNKRASGGRARSRMMCSSTRPKLWSSDRSFRIFRQNTHSIEDTWSAIIHRAWLTLRRSQFLSPSTGGH